MDTCLSTGKGCWYAVIFDEKGRTDLRDFEVGVTSIQLRMIGVARSLEKTPEGSEVNFYIRSKHIVLAVTNWIWKWQKNCWKNSDGGVVRDKDLWTEIFILISRRKMKWILVGGDGHPILTEVFNLAAKEWCFKWMSKWSDVSIEAFLNSGVEINGVESSVQVFVPCDLEEKKATPIIKIEESVERVVIKERRSVLLGIWNWIMELLRRVFSKKKCIKPAKPMELEEVITKPGMESLLDKSDAFEKKIDVYLKKSHHPVDNDKEATAEAKEFAKRLRRNFVAKFYMDVDGQYPMSVNVVNFPRLRYIRKEKGVRQEIFVIWLDGPTMKQVWEVFVSLNVPSYIYLKMQRFLSNKMVMKIAEEVSLKHGIKNELGYLNPTDDQNAALNVLNKKFFKRLEVGKERYKNVQLPSPDKEEINTFKYRNRNLFKMV